MRHKELKDMLLEREYPDDLVEKAIQKAKKIPRARAFKKVVAHKEQRKPFFVTFFNPRLPNLKKIQVKHYRTMTSYDPYLKEVYPEPPLIAYKRQKNMRETLVRARVAPARHIRLINGMTKCNKCLACSHIKEGTTMDGKTYKRYK